MKSQIESLIDFCAKLFSSFLRIFCYPDSPKNLASNLLYTGFNNLTANTKQYLIIRMAIQKQKRNTASTARKVAPLTMSLFSKYLCILFYLFLIYYYNLINYSSLIQHKLYLLSASCICFTTDLLLLTYFLCNLEYFCIWKHISLRFLRKYLLFIWYLLYMYF